MLAQAPRAPAIKVDAQELFASYERDVVAADKKYTGKIVEIDNISGKIQKDGSGRYFVMLHCSTNCSIA